MADFLCALALIGALLPGCGPEPPLATGYVEGEYVHLAPLAPARLVDLRVGRGDRVEAGQLLAAVEAEDARLALAAAEAAQDRAASELADLEQGARPSEIAALEAALASARANARHMAREAERQERLAQQSASSRAQLDAARASAEIAQAAVGEAEARLETARLPPRPDMVQAARAAVKQALADRQALEWQMRQRQLTAPAAGTVTDILRHRGEMAGPEAPVLTLLPDGATVLRFFLPQGELASVAIGTRLRVTCDGCQPVDATVSFIAGRAEFTPPVIYSRDARQKLVYQAEARPDPGSPLKPGQIVEVWKAP